MPNAPAILFTAFEPSGDEHAAPVIAGLLRRNPGLRICAMGGPRMAAAGAELIETTTTRSAMGVSAVSQALSHRRRLARLRAWIDQNPLLAHVPTDSPAANWAICRMVKDRWGQAGDHNAYGRVIHLVAPQVWAWASWRVRRLRRWSDHVLCILPFEPDWFARHQVPATFIGHPLFDEPADHQPLDDLAPPGRPRLALLPGSRRAEVKRNWPVMLHTFRALSRQFEGLSAVVAAADEAAAAKIRASMTHEQQPENLTVLPGRMNDVVAWADAVLTVSGTATLHVTRQVKPMVVIYRVNPIAWHAVGRWLMNTTTFTLPNLIAGNGPHHDRTQHIVPEFVPFLGSPARVGPIVEALAPLLQDTPQRTQQVDDLRKVTRAFEGRVAGDEAAEVILKILN